MSEQEQVLKNIALVLKQSANDKGIIDVGSGREKQFGVSQTVFNQAVDLLQEEGYELHRIKAKQKRFSRWVVVRVLAPPGTSHEDMLELKGLL